MKVMRRDCQRLRNTGRVGLGLIIALGLAACGGGSSQSGSKISNPVNFAVLAGYTSANAAAAAGLLNGAKVAQYLINNNGGISGSKVQLIPEDDGFDPIDAVTVVRKVIALDHASVILGITGLDYQNALPIIEQNKVVDFNTIGDPSVDRTVRKYTYSVGVSDALGGAAMAVQASKMGYKKIALVFDSTLGSQGFVPAIKFAATKLGLSIVAVPTVPQTAPSYQAEVQQVLQSSPDAVLMQLQPPQVGGFFKDWTAAGGTQIPIIVSNEALSDPEWAPAAGADEAKNHITAVASISNVATPGGQLFVNTWKQLFNSPYAFFGAYAYDGETLGALAIEAAGSSDPTVFQPFVDDVTSSATGHTPCDTYQACSALLKAGKKIKFSGVATALEFNQYHRVAADFGVYQPPLTATEAGTLLSTIPAAEVSAVS